MNSQHPLLNRRGFLQLSGALGLSALIAKSSLFASDTPQPKLAKRKFGKTGVEVPILSLGAMYDTVMNPVILEQCYQNGVHYWDTAAGYAKGQSEVGIGLYLEKHPEARKQLFIVTKASGGHTAKRMTELLNQSLERMKTSYIDLYFLHGIDRIDKADTPEIKAWAEEAKKSGKIRFFGFSTHANMEQCLMGASKLGWIDGIMLTYTYRNMGTPAMSEAMEACYNAGIGLTAMKVVDAGLRREKAIPANESVEALLAPVIAKGFTPAQAKIKAVLESQHLSTACLQMQSIQYFQENYAAATDMRPLTAADREALRAYAEATCSNHCIGCSHLCEAAIAGTVPVRDVLRYHMYHESYGMEEEAVEKLTRLPSEVRERLASMDFSAAESVCPNRLPLTELMRHSHSLIA